MDACMEQGTPMMLMGDEYGHTRNGNNNSYGHDTALNHFLWNQLDQARSSLFRFTAAVNRLRSWHPALGQADFLSPRDITWHEDNWDNYESRFLAFSLHDVSRTCGDLYVAFNAHSFAVDAGLPPPPAGRQWVRLVDTNLPSPRDIVDDLETIATNGRNVCRTFFTVAKAPHSSTVFTRGACQAGKVKVYGTCSSIEIVGGVAARRFFSSTTAATHAGNAAASHGAKAQVNGRSNRPSVIFRLTRGVAGLGIVGALGWVAMGEDPLLRLKLLVTVPVRVGRVVTTVLAMVADYKTSLRGLPAGSEEMESEKRQCHLRCADRLQAMCFRNGGIYIKLGQHIAQLDYIVPEEYVTVMKESMLNTCPVTPYEDVRLVIQSELGKPPEEIFSSFDPVPVASASLAQVHRGKLKSGEDVAVKVQHAHLLDTAAADMVSVRLVISALYWFFPSLDYRWLITEVEESLPKELDFALEASNGRHCMANFRSSPSKLLRESVAVPRSFLELTGQRVLTMEWMEGVPLTDVARLKDMGINPADVAKLDCGGGRGGPLCKPFNALSFLSSLPSLSPGYVEPEVVLLDHGLYRQLPDSLRLNYAHLWKALVLADARGIMQYSIALGAGADLYAIFAATLTLRSWENIVEASSDHLFIPDTAEEKKHLQKSAAAYFNDITRLLARLPRVLLLLLKTNDCLRSLDTALGTPVNTFMITARECTQAIAEADEKALISKAPNSLALRWKAYVHKRLQIAQVSIAPDRSSPHLTALSLSRRFRAVQPLGSGIMERYDVVVVGAGIMGSCAAYELAKRGRSVLLLEQFDLLHRRGSSHGDLHLTRLDTPPLPSPAAWISAPAAMLTWQPFSPAVATTACHISFSKELH
ncbi:unnamed protein product [Closterium sp. NIES-53]